MKKLSCLLALAIVCTPLSSKAPDKGILDWCGVELVAFGLIIYQAYCLYHRYDHWDPSMISDPPPGWGEPFNPVDEPPPTQATAHAPRLQASSCSFSGASAYPPFTNVIGMVFQSSTNLSDWQTRYTLKIWESPDGRLALVKDSAGSTVWTNYASRVNGVSTNYIPMLSITGSEPKEFFRLVSP